VYDSHTRPFLSSFEFSSTTADLQRLLLQQQPKMALTPSLSHRALHDVSSGGNFAPVEINIFTMGKNPLLSLLKLF
jgi:hypothetical protein